MEPGKASVQGKKSVLDIAAIRAAASKYDDGAVTDGYKGNRAEILAMLNEALATEIVCMLRYRRHYYTAKGIDNVSIKAEFLEHANDEEEHANTIAERIVQLNGEPDLDPVHLAEKSIADYDESTDIREMIKANLVAERLAIEAYRQMIERIGDTDPTTTLMLTEVLTKEEEHAEDMRDLLG